MRADVLPAPRCSASSSVSSASSSVLGSPTLLRPPQLDIPDAPPSPGATSGQPGLSQSGGQATHHVVVAGTPALVDLDLGFDDNLGGAPLLPPAGRDVASTDDASAGDSMRFDGSSGATAPPSVSSPFLGRGACGSVSVEYSPGLGRSVAVKTVREMTDERSRCVRAEIEFARRALALAESEAFGTDDQTESPAATPMAREDAETVTDGVGVWDHLVRVLEIRRNSVTKQCAIIMELMAGGTVGTLPGTALLGCNSAAERAAPLRALAVIARDCLRGLAVLHEKIEMVHRDIKPENLLVDADGRVKLADFGMAAVLPNSPPPRHVTDQRGSLLFMSPERLRGDAHGDTSDVWALGVTVLQLANGGSHPFVDTTTLSGCGDRFWSLAAVLRHTGTLAECEAASRAAVDRCLRRLVPSTETELDRAFIDFVRAALHPDPHARPTARVLFALPFVQRAAGNRHGPQRAF